MYRDKDEVHLSEDEASGGEKNHHMRYVLAISLILALGLMSAVWIIPALFG